MVVFATIMAIREKKRIAAAQLLGTTPFEQDCLHQDLAEDMQTDVKPKNLFFNISLVLIAVLLLAFGLFSAPYVFMLALVLALIVNFPRPTEQMAAISRHAPQALSMVAIIFAAGAFLGILSESGMLKAIAVDLIRILPSTWIGSLHIVVGMLGVPLDLFTSTDAYYFALLPIIQEVTATAGVPADAVVYSMAIGNNAGTFVSPFSPATWLAMGLAGIDMGKHLRYSFGWIWLFSFFTLGAGYLLGLY